MQVWNVTTSVTPFSIHKKGFQQSQIWLFFTELLAHNLWPAWDLHKKHNQQSHEQINCVCENTLHHCSLAKYAISHQCTHLTVNQPRSERTEMTWEEVSHILLCSCSVHSWRILKNALNKRWRDKQQQQKSETNGSAALMGCSVEAWIAWDTNCRHWTTHTYPLENNSLQV